MKVLWKTLLMLMIVLSITAFLQGQGDTPKESDTSYFRNLIKKGNATYYDGFRVMNILVKGQDTPDISFEELKTELVKEKIIPQRWANKAKPDKFINRANMSYMVVKALGIKGGLTMRVMGVTPRYAFRECVRKRLMARGYPNQRLSGGDLISVLARAEKYQSEQKEGNK